MKAPLLALLLTLFGTSLATHSRPAAPVAAALARPTATVYVGMGNMSVSVKIVHLIDRILKGTAPKSAPIFEKKPLGCI
jgi:hypothetical protein